MAFKDSIKNLFNYFEVDDELPEYEEKSRAYQMENTATKTQFAPTPLKEVKKKEQAVATRPSVKPSPEWQPQKTNMERLNEKQHSLLSAGDTQKSTISIKFPKRYEEAPEIVNLLLDNESVLIDFQFMTDVQARRCLDYLDGARSVLSGNLKKVSNTMWLLTPVNVMVNAEELRSFNSQAHGQYDYDYDVRR